MWLPEGITVGWLVWAAALQISLLIYLYGAGKVVIVFRDRLFGASPARIFDQVRAKEQRNP